MLANTLQDNALQRILRQEPFAEAISDREPTDVTAHGRPRSEYGIFAMHTVAGIYC